MDWPLSKRQLGWSSVAAVVLALSGANGSLAMGAGAFVGSLVLLSALAVVFNVSRRAVGTARAAE